LFVLNPSFVMPNTQAVPNQVLSYLGYNHAPEAVDTIREQIRHEMKNLNHDGFHNEEDRYRNVKKMLDKTGQRIFKNGNEEDAYRDFERAIENQARGFVHDGRTGNEEDRYMPHGTGWLERTEDVIDHIAHDISHGIKHQNEVNEEDRSVVGVQEEVEEREKSMRRRRMVAMVIIT